MKCAYHPEKDAIYKCNHCAKEICSDCLVEEKHEMYCKDCFISKTQGKKSVERSPALAALLSFIIPGLGQIYNGQVGKCLLIFFTGLLVIPWVIGIFDAYNTAKSINEGKIEGKHRIGCLIAFVVGVVVFMMGIFFMAMISAIAIPNLLQARLNANQSAAEATVRTISTAAETYHGVDGKYPLSEANLTEASPAYLTQSYNHKEIFGYIISEEFQESGYKIVAAPKACGTSGRKLFTMETGRVFNSQDCSSVNY